MKRLHNLNSLRRLHEVAIILMICALASCGGDDAGLEPHEAELNDVNSGYSIHIALYNEISGAPSTSISGDAPGELVIQVSQFGVAKASELVSLTTTLGSIGSGTSSVLTNASGEARVLLLADDLDGAGTVTVSINTEQSGRLTLSLNFSSLGGGQTTTDDGVDITLSLVSENGTPNTIRGDDPGTVTARLLSQSGAPLTNTVVTFTSDIVSFNPAAGTALTDTDGFASLQGNGGSVTGIATIIATVVQGDTEFSESLNITVEPPSIQFGSRANGTFVPNVLQVSISPLSAGGTTSVSASVIGEDNQPFDVPLSVLFSSNCVSQSSATIDASVITVNGEATATYQASGCVGTDQITATIDFGGVQYTATSDIEILSDDVGSIIFANAEPDSIVLRGAGGQGLSETSAVSFQVFGSQGLPVANQEVEFSLTSTVGGITLNPTTALSDANGFVTTTVQAGSIATSVVVIASLPELDISTQSGILVVSTGVPDQDSMSIAMEICNPEAWSIDGQTVTITGFAADAFNNPVPDGVSLSFTTEGGSVSPSCTTVNGSCTVEWTSQEPRPTDGRVTIMVTAIGAESFGDENGNGIFDDGDILGINDLTEAYRDDNRNGVRDSNEPYIDFNVNGMFDSEDGLYNGPTCEDSARCAEENGVTVRADMAFVMSGSETEFSYNPASGSLYTSKSRIDVTVSDQNLNSLPGGTTVTVVQSIGILLTDASFVIDSKSINPFTFAVRVDLDDVEPATGSGFLTITTLTPSGIERSGFFEFTY